MTFKGEIAFGALNTKFNTGFAIGDIYRVQGSGNLVPNSYPVSNGEFVEWTEDGWRHSDEHYTTTSETAGIIDDSIDFIRSSVFDNGTPSIESIIRVSEETYDSYNVNDYWTRSGMLYLITDKIHEADTDVWQFETIRVSGVVPALNDIKTEADKMQVIAAALNDLDARLKAVEESISSVNIGSRVADELDAQSLKVGGEDINTIIQNAIGG